MNSGKERNARVIDELRKSMTADEGVQERNYTFRQYTVDGRRYATLADLQGHEVKIVTPEESVIAGFAKLMGESSDRNTREFARTVNNILWLHQSGKENLKETPVYQISKEYSDKVSFARPGSVERDLLLVTATEKIKSAYRSLMSDENN